MSEKWSGLPRFRYEATVNAMEPSSDCTASHLRDSAPKARAWELNENPQVTSYPSSCPLSPELPPLFDDSRAPPPSSNPLVPSFAAGLALSFVALRPRCATGLHPDGSGNLQVP